MTTIMFSLVGEQPAPNVLPLRHFRPDKIALVHTDLTADLANRIAGVINAEFEVIRPFCKTEPYLVNKIRTELTDYITTRIGDADLIFNLTGGTKTMEYAALEVARQLKAQAFYYQTEGNQNLIHPYHFNTAGELVCETPKEAKTTLSIHEFLSLYVKEYCPAEERELTGKLFERNVLAVLTELGSDYEILPNQRLIGFSSNVEVDWILSFRNTFAVGEVKLRGSKTRGIDQLNTATEQRMLGTYTKKFLITADSLHENDLDLAHVCRISTIVLPSGRQSSLSDTDRDKLIQTIRTVMEPKR